MQYTNRYSNIIILPKCGKTDKLNNHQNSKITDCKLLKGNARQSHLLNTAQKIPWCYKSETTQKYVVPLVILFLLFQPLSHKVSAI